MQFSPHKRRRAPSVIIVSLIDVLLVVLIFLMISTTFKDIPAFKLNLPETKQAPPAPGANENPPLVITITTNAPRLYLGKTAVTLDRLQKELIDRSKENPRLIIAIRADEQAAYGDVVKVQEAARAAQVKEIRAFLKSGVRPE